MIGMSQMGYSDERILRVLRTVSSETPLTATEIARRAKMPYGTVKRRIGIMERARLIERDRIGRRWGSVYKVLVHDTTDD